MNFLIFIGLVALVMLIGAKLGEVSFQVCSTFCEAFSRFWAKPPHVVLVGVLAWSTSIILLLLWMSHKF